MFDEPDLTRIFEAFPVANGGAPFISFTINSRLLSIILRPITVRVLVVSVSSPGSFISLSSPFRCTAVSVILSLPAHPLSVRPSHPASLSFVQSLRSILIQSPLDSSVLHSHCRRNRSQTDRHFINYCTNESRRGGLRGARRGAPPWPPAPASPAR